MRRSAAGWRRSSRGTSRGPVPGRDPDDHALRRQHRPVPGGIRRPALPGASPERRAPAQRSGTARPLRRAPHRARRRLPGRHRHRDPPASPRSRGRRGGGWRGATGGERDRAGGWGLPHRLRLAAGGRGRPAGGDTGPAGRGDRRRIPRHRHQVASDAGTLRADGRPSSSPLCSGLDSLGPRDGRSRPRPDPAKRREGDVLQLAHYQRMLEACRARGTRVPATPGIIGTERRVVWYDLDASRSGGPPPRRARPSSARPWSGTTSSSTSGSTSWPSRRTAPRDPSVEPLVVPVRCDGVPELPLG
jgi:hypothetical protein